MEDDLVLLSSDDRHLDKKAFVFWTPESVGEYWHSWFGLRRESRKYDIKAFPDLRDHLRSLLAAV